MAWRTVNGVNPLQHVAFRPAFFQGKNPPGFPRYHEIQANSRIYRKTGNRAMRTSTKYYTFIHYSGGIVKTTSSVKTGILGSFGMSASIGLNDTARKGRSEGQSLIPL